MSDAMSGAPNPAPASAGAGLIPETFQCLQWAGVTSMLQCGSFEFNRLLRERIAPMPVRVDGVTFWYLDEITHARAKIHSALMYWRSRKPAGPRPT